MPSMEELIALMKEMNENLTQGQLEMIEKVKNIRKGQIEMKEEIIRKIKREVNEMPEEIEGVTETNNIQEEDEGSQDDTDSRSDLKGDQDKGRRSCVEVQEAAREEESIENCSGQEEKEQGKGTFVIPVVEESLEARTARKEEGDKVLLPGSKREEGLSDIHGGNTGIHPAVKRARAKQRRRFSLVGYHEDGVDWGSRSTEWVAMKRTSRGTNGALRQDKLVLPLKRIAFDMAGPSPEYRRRRRFKLVAMDHFSKWAETHVVADQDASMAAAASTVYQILGVRRTRTTPLHPHSDGMVERIYRTLEGSLEAEESDVSGYVAELRRKWRAARGKARGRKRLDSDRKKHRMTGSHRKNVPERPENLGV
uniref:Uncharacterized protein n=1 Tax=Rhodnius prolixus TaxID=13249 RepID=T1IDZ9_RHOPR